MSNKSQPYVSFVIPVYFGLCFSPTLGCILAHSMVTVLSGIFVCTVEQDRFVIVGIFDDNLCCMYLMIDYEFRC